MKLIFLDIDGVLNFTGCRDKIGDIYFVNDNRVKLLKEIIDRTNAKVVLSSTWRTGWKDREEKRNTQDAEDFTKLEEKLKEYGISLFSYTPVLKNRHRGSEIHKWLEQWTKELSVESFIILDDDTDMKPYSDQLVQTSYKHGLSRKNVEKAVTKLNTTL